ncbi:hypothetical protein FQR65_LT02073 [Abscondita terminalis]|nr:hypothetical protein FQR65_LT02073 [Abscondita terminalis]
MWKAALFISLVSATFNNVYAVEQPKRRAPSGFTGVRGKKSIPETAYSDTSQLVPDPSETVLDDDIEKRAPSGFMGMRGKKPFPDPDAFVGNKRAPSGFMGMRGKKDNDFNSLVEDYEKRAPSGFMGMRGKKDLDDDLHSNGYVDKRAPNGFMGMRGKKSYDDMVDEMKRAVMSGFFGMRGKKQPSRSSFFGMRGKKYPYEFRGKFVGVRGKKSSNEVGDYGYLNGHVDNELQYPQTVGDLDLNQLMLLLNSNNGLEWSHDNGNDYAGQESV